MKPVTLLLCCMLLLSVCRAQEPAGDNKNVTTSAARTEPSFPGGVNQWFGYLQRNIKTNTAAKRNAPRGTYTVEAAFTIDTTGKLINIEILVDPGYGCADDVKRVLEKSPLWIPAMVDGKKVVYKQRQGFSYLVE